MKRAWVFAALLLGACATTSLMDTWKDPAFSGPPKKRLLVVGVSKSDSNRRVFEDGFVKALAASGSGGSPSYAVLPALSADVNERLAGAVRSAGADGVLVTRVLRVRRDVEVRTMHSSPGFYGAGFRGYYGHAYGPAYTDVSTYDVLTIETTLWDISKDKPMWSGTSEVTAPKSVAAATEELAGVLIKKMKADGVI